MKRLKRYAYEKYAVLCQLAYPSDEASLSQVNLANYGEFEQIELYDRFHKSCVRIVWQPDKKEVVVVFRGSHNLYDWLLNMCLFQSKYKDNNRHFSVHWGMQKLLRQPSYTKEGRSKLPLEQRIKETLAPLVKQEKKLTFIGHSTGGSLAVIFADRLNHAQNVKIKRVVTFGQPSCGGQQFYRQYSLHHKTYRICCDVDIVTFLPPLPFYYRHVGKSLWLNDGTMFENIGPTKRLWLSLKSWLLRPITYHYMNKYISNKSLFEDN